MATVVLSERLVGTYDGVTPPALLPKGAICGGLNMRKVSQGGGWKVRKGCALHNTTVLETGTAVKSLHYYANPFAGDEHFIAQCNSKLLTETAQNKLPPTVDASFGTTLGVTVGTTPGFTATVGEYMFYADGSGKPIAWGGASPRIKGMFTYDISELKYSDYSRKVTDGRADTHGHILGAATDQLIIITEERCSGLTFDLGAGVNSTGRVLAVKAWRSGTWTAVSSLVDGTESPAGTPFAVDGTITWTRSALDTLYTMQGLMGYAYQLTWADALSGTVDVVSITATQVADHMTNKWNGEMHWVTGARFYDLSATAFVECLGKVTNESTSMYQDLSEAQTGDFLYLKTPEPATMFMFGVVADYVNTANAQIDSVEYWNGAGWTALTTNLSDKTLDDAADTSFSQTGSLTFDGGVATPERMLMEGDPIPGYWYRISWDAALSTDVRLYAIGYGTFPDSLPAYDGCVEFKNRLLTWGDPEFPNRLRFSARGNPFCFSGADSGYTDAFGAEDVILCAVKFYNELIVFKKHEVWLLEGEGPATFGTLKITDKVGLASPKSVQVAEVGFPTAHRDEPMTIAMWQDIDGVYTFDGRKTKKESLPVDDYFNPEKSNCIAAASIRSLQSFVDPVNNEYHLLLPATELVFNYVTAEWYPPWTRAIVLATGVDFRANDNRHYAYGASAAGWIMRLETDTTDKNAANADVLISHSIKSRAIGYEGTERIVRFTLRRILAELVARAAGSITTKTFKDLASTGVTQDIPQAMSMVNTGYNIAVPHLEMSIEDLRCFQVEFSLAVADQEMEIHGFSYEIAGSGLSEQ